MAKPFYIPPVFVDAEPPETLPPGSAFNRMPVEDIVKDDLVRLNGQVWRVKSRIISRQTIRIVLVLYPVRGGRPHSAEFYPRQWLFTARGF